MDGHPSVLTTATNPPPPPKVRDAMVGKSSLSTGLSAVEASTALDLLAQHAPEAVCIEKQVRAQRVPCSRMGWAALTWGSGPG